MTLMHVEMCMCVHRPGQYKHSLHTRMCKVLFTDSAVPGGNRPGLRRTHPPRIPPSLTQSIAQSIPLSLTRNSGNLIRLQLSRYPSEFSTLHIMCMSTGLTRVVAPPISFSLPPPTGNTPFRSKMPTPSPPPMTGVLQKSRYTHASHRTRTLPSQAQTLSPLAQPTDRVPSTAWSLITVPVFLPSTRLLHTRAPHHGTTSLLHAG